MFLIGHPGPSRRQLAMAFCELTQREVEYVSLSRDTTETDLKQRREIINSTVHYVDQVCCMEKSLGRRLPWMVNVHKCVVCCCVSFVLPFEAVLLSGVCCYIEVVW